MKRKKAIGICCISYWNFYAHGYDALDWTRVWETLEKEIPKLKLGFQNILNELEEKD